MSVATVGSGKTYETLALWHAWAVADHPDLVSTTQIAEAQCYDKVDTTALTITGWTSSADYYPWVHAVGDGEHGGVRGAGYRRQISSGNGLTISQNYTRVEGIACRGVTASKSSILVTVAGDGVLINRCFLYDGQHGIYSNATGTLTVRNTIAITMSSTGIYGFAAATVNLDNCTFCVASSAGFYRNAGTMTCRNCYGGGNTIADYSGTIGKTTCASSDGTGGITVAYAVGSGAYFTNVTAGSEDLHLTSTSSGLYDVGTDLSVTFTDDIDGQTRVQWDIGADEFITGASAALSGTITTAVESDIVAGGKTIILTLTGDTWVATGGAFEAQRQAIINGVDSAQSEANGWDVEKANLPLTDVVRTNDTVATITLSALGAYVITADEVLTATIPADALVTSASPVVASPTATITNETPGTSALLTQMMMQ